MKTLLTTFVLLLGISLFCEDSWGAQAGGIRIRRSKNGNNSAADEKKKKQEEEVALHKQHIEAMPMTVPIPEADTSEFDANQNALNLTDDQKKRIKVLKEEIRSKSEVLMKAEKEAADRFRKVDEANCSDAGRLLNAAVADARNYGPDVRFRNGIANILTAEQLQKLKSGQAKDKKA